MAVEYHTRSYNVYMSYNDDRERKREKEGEGAPSGRQEWYRDSTKILRSVIYMIVIVIVTVETAVAVRKKKKKGIRSVRSGGLIGDLLIVVRRFGDRNSRGDRLQARSLGEWD